MLPRVNAVRYIQSMREGGSLPALVEADDGRTYVVKLRGAGQGPRALAAEVLTGELAGMLGLRVPRLALVTLDPAFGKTEPDPEIQDLFQRSAGLNVGLEFLHGATVFDPAADDVADAREASRTVWLDAFTRNVDRTPRNANLLMQHGKLWLIDHGASLIFHFDWPSAQPKALSPFSEVREHILLRWASEVEAAGQAARQALTPEALDALAGSVPDDFLPADDGMTAAAQCAGYFDYFIQRLEHSSIFEKEIARVRPEAL